MVEDVEKDGATHVWVRLTTSGNLWQVHVDHAERDALDLEMSQPISLPRIDYVLARSDRPLSNPEQLLVEEHRYTSEVGLAGVEFPDVRIVAAGSRDACLAAARLLRV